MKNSTFALLIAITFSHITFSYAQITPTPEPSITERKCASEVNLIQNGNFMYGNDGSFQSGLPLKCNSCTSGSYCIGNQFKSKCSSWSASDLDHTLGTVSGSFLIVDGHPSNVAIVWSDSVCVCAGKTYTFSFWVKSIYPAAQQNFNLGMLINSVNAQTVNVAQQPTAWTQHKANWTATKTECIPIAIQQLTGGAYRDFGLDDIFFGYCCDCKPQAAIPDCCQFGLRLFNDVANTFKKVKVTPAVPSSLTDVFLDSDLDGDNWSLTKASGGAYYEFTYLNGYIPIDPANLIDVDFNLIVQPNAVNPKITVEWIDGNNITKNKEEVKLICSTNPASYGEDVEIDWMTATTPISGTYTQNQVFSGAEQEPCQGPEEADRSGSCGLSGKINCAGTSLTLTANTISGATEYRWYVYDNGNVVSSTTTSSPSLNVSLSLSGQGSVSVNLDAGYMKTITDTDPSSPTYGSSWSVYESLCSDLTSISYCILSAEFTWGTPKAKCLGTSFQGWEVVFTPLMSCPNITSYKWTFGDNSTTVQGSGAVNSQTHLYASAGSYNVTLSLTDINGCTSTIVKKLVIPTGCTPEFHANYSWCESDGSDPTKQYSITVTFTNQSLCICNSTFIWDFGDPTSGSANSATTTCNATVSHTYMTKPGDIFNVKLTMKDNPVCPNGVSVSHQVLLKPICSDFNLKVCQDGVVQFSTSCGGRQKWNLPNWQAITENPSYYCFPVPFDPWLNIQINAAMGLFQTSVPQVFYNLISIKKFEMKFKDGAVFGVSLTNYEDTNPYTTGSCTIRKEARVVYSCCGNLKAKEFDYRTINNKDFKMTKFWQVKHKTKHDVPILWTGPGAPLTCIDYYVRLISGDRTHFKAQTKLFKKKRIRGRNYYFPSLAETITARIKGDFRTGNSSGCNCEDKAPWDTGLSRNNWYRATYQLTGSKLYKMQPVDLVRSVHVVKKAGVIWDSYISKPPGGCWTINGY